MYSIDFSLNNGLGKPSVSIYFSGCDIPNKCPNCHNPELWLPQENQVDYDELYKIIKKTQSFTKDLTVSFLGGEPLASYNRELVKKISGKLKKDFPEIKLILYSWRSIDEIEESWITNFDYGVLGKFKIDQLQEGYLPASSNQVIYNFKTKKIIKAVKIRK